MDSTKTSTPSESGQAPAQRSPLLKRINFICQLLLATALGTLGIQQNETLYFVTAGGLLLFPVITLFQFLHRDSRRRQMLPEWLMHNRNFELSSNLLAGLGFCLIAGSLLLRWFY